MHTNERRYPSHDSRGIVNGSSSEVRSIGESAFPAFLVQKLFFSVGDGFIHRCISAAMVIGGSNIGLTYW